MDIRLVEGKLSGFIEFLKRRKVLIVFSLVLFAAALVMFIVFIRNSNERSGYIFDTAYKTSVTEVVSESGSITSDGNLPLYSPTNGIVTEVYVKNGQRVKKDEGLFKVVSSTTEQEKQTAYANYLAAKATLDASVASMHTLQSAMFSSWKIYTDLATNSTYENPDGSPNTANRTLPEYTAAQNNWFAAEENYKNQQGVIARDQAALASATTMYTQTQTTVVKSPQDGIVENISFSQGGTIHVQSVPLATVKPALIIKNSDFLEAVIPVGQTNIAKVESGQSVLIRPDAYKEKKYTGTVVRIDSIGENMQGIVNYNVYVKVAGDEFLKPGMTFDSDITTQKLKNVLTVPNSAIVLNDGLKSVRIFDKGSMKYIPVITGIKGETRTQILEGLTEGQEIVVALTNVRAEKPGFLGL